MRRVTRRRAARLAIMGALLDAERPHGILETVRHLMRLQMDPPERRWGYYVLPVLRGDRFIARFDARAFRATGEFHVFSVHAEPGANEGDARAVGREIRRLARWSGAPDVVYGKVPRGWRSALA